jgi:hypothetical protein
MMLPLEKLGRTDAKRLISALHIGAAAILLSQQGRQARRRALLGQESC